MLDINGQEIRKGEHAQLLCEVLDIQGDGIAVRIVNSDMVMSVGFKNDEVLGGLVADSELTAFQSVNLSHSDVRGKSAPAFE